MTVLLLRRIFGQTIFDNMVKKRLSGNLDIPKFTKNWINFLGTDFPPNICGDVFVLVCTFRNRNRILIIYHNLKQNVF